MLCVTGSHISDERKERNDDDDASNIPAEDLQSHLS